MDYDQLTGSTGEAWQYIVHIAYLSLKEATYFGIKSESSQTKHELDMIPKDRSIVH